MKILSQFFDLKLPERKYIPRGLIRDNSYYDYIEYLMKPIKYLGTSIDKSDIV